MAYKGTDSETGEQYTGGDPSPEEEYHGEQKDDTAKDEFDPEKHPDNYIMRM